VIGSEPNAALNIASDEKEIPRLLTIKNPALGGALRCESNHLDDDFFVN
jgi:hypothetical protein